MSQQTYLIDPPSPFASAAEWREYLAELEQEPRSVQIEDAITEAKQAIARAERNGLN